MRFHSFAAAALFSATSAFAQVEKPAALVVDGVPPVPTELAAATRPYMEYRTATFLGWHPQDRSMLIATRFGNTAQIHRVAQPMGARTQMSFEGEPVTSGSWAPKTGDVLVVEKDVGGSEFYQLYTLKDGQLRLLTDGKSRNQFSTWSDDGSLIAYSSTKRNGTDSDLYVMDPRDPTTARMVAQVSGGGWAISAIAPDKKTALVGSYKSITNVDLYQLDLVTGAMTAIGDTRKDISYGQVDYAPDGRLWVLSDEGSDFQRLGTLDPKSGRFTPRTPAESWDIESFKISSDGRIIAYVVNEAGISRLRVLDVASGTVRTVAGLPAGVIGSLSVSNWGEIGLSLSSSTSPSDVYSVNPDTLAVTRWTASETGGLDATRNAQASLVEIKSFDGLTMSGFLYRPDAQRFPGKRPMLMWVHGGPESQSRPAFLGAYNYLVNELGIALFYPNVRGSSGYGKAFVSLDNGPFKREDSVKDMGAFLDALAKDPGLDASRFALTGRSYGGYMCYAAAVWFADKLKSTHCVVAISNFVTFLETTQSYRRDLRRVEYGDERDPKQRAKLLAISPLLRVKEMKKPMFTVTGGNDPRVPASEAEQVVTAIRANGGTVWHLLASNEGHIWGKKENNDYAFWSALQFYKQTLLDD